MSDVRILWRGSAEQKCVCYVVDASSLSNTPGVEGEGIDSCEGGGGVYNDRRCTPLPGLPAKRCPAMRFLAFFLLFSTVLAATELQPGQTIRIPFPDLPQPLAGGEAELVVQLPQAFHSQRNWPVFLWLTRIKPLGWQRLDTRGQSPGASAPSATVAAGWVSRAHQRPVWGWR